MSLFNINFLSGEKLAEALKMVGADMRSLPFFDNRREVKALYISNADIRAANVIKQEMLARGGDVAVSRFAVDCRAEKSDIILFGTKKQLAFLADKIEAMSWWNFPQIASEIRQALNGMASGKYSIKLPCGAEIEFGRKTMVMGIINLTDDSFYSTSRTGSDSRATVERAVRFAAEGADILDLGAESTRPGSSRVPEEEEISRIADAVKNIRKTLPQIPLSIDTTRASVARAALDAGADIINDISGLTYEPEVARAAADYGAMLVLMHMRGTPETMQSMCDYENSNILQSITDFFDKGIETAASNGLERAKIILDPGLGFAKNYNQNLFLMQNLRAFDTFGLPILIGASRKGTVGKATGADKAEDRLEGTLAITSLCAWHDIDIVRVHDVKENKKTVMMIEAIKNAAIFG